MLSIIVLSYNHEQFIEENIKGIFSQKINFPIELIICDDLSPDNTDAIIKNLLKETPSHIEVKYTRHEKNMGSTPNFYFALKQVTGDYIAFCEGDDYWTDDNKLQKQYDFLQQHHEYSLCFHQAMNVSPYPKINGTLFSKVENREYTPEEIYLKWTIHTATVMMRKSVLESDAFKKTLKDPTLVYFDSILFLAASTVGKLFGFSDTMSAYRRHDAGLSFGVVNYKRDLKHNHLDEIIGSYHQGKIQNISKWLIFNRSLNDFKSSLKKGQLGVAFQFLKWIIKYHKNFIIYLCKKYNIQLKS